MNSVSTATPSNTKNPTSPALKHTTTEIRPSSSPVPKAPVSHPGANIDQYHYTQEFLRKNTYNYSTK